MIKGDSDNNILTHSYPNKPPEYSTPQVLYKYHYEGPLTTTNYIWTINPPFYILEGQGTSGITIELYPKNSTSREKIISGVTILEYCELNLQIDSWKESLYLYYKVGPSWKIEGNKFPQITIISGKTVKSTETYKIIPKYDQSGYPAKYSTYPDSYSFYLDKGKIVNFYGGVPPKYLWYGEQYPMVDIFWYTTGATSLTFYSSWTNEKEKFPITIPIYISQKNN